MSASSSSTTINTETALSSTKAPPSTPAEVAETAAIHAAVPTATTALNGTTPAAAVTNNTIDAAVAPTLTNGSTAATVTSSSLPSIWLDCDPGHDDCLAILLTAYSSHFTIVGMSTVSGNMTLDLTTTNALQFLSACGLTHIPVYAGRSQPLMRKGLVCPEIHGENGLGGPSFPPLTVTAKEKKAYEAIADALKNSSEAVTIIATGPLTNIALFLLTHPELATTTHLRRIVLMGGAIGFGNTHPAAEFNIQVDPEAARIVFESGVDVTMVPLEVTHTALVTPSVLQRIAHYGQFGEFINTLLLFFRDTYRSVFKFTDPPLHDPCAVFYCMCPDAFEAELMRVDVDCESSLCAGRTVCDVFNRDTTGRRKNVRVCTAMNVERFFDALIDAIGKAAKHSTLIAPPPPAVIATIAAENGISNGSA